MRRGYILICMTYLLITTHLAYAPAPWHLLVKYGYTYEYSLP